MNSSATKKLVHLKAGKILSFRSTCAQHLYLRNACKSRVLPGKKGHLTVRAEQGKNGTAAVLFRGETVHHNGAELEAEWGTLSDYFTMPLSQWDTGRMKYWKQEEKFCKDDVSGYPCLYWRANLLISLISTLMIHWKAIHMTKRHSLKFGFARMGTTGVSSLYEEGWFDSKTTDCIHSAQPRCNQQVQLWESQWGPHFYKDFCISYLHKLCYFYKHI